jgi:CHAD domain-containing protein
LNFARQTDHGFPLTIDFDRPSKPSIESQLSDNHAPVAIDHDAVNAAVKSDRLRVFLVDFFRWMEVGNWRQRTSAKPQKSIEDFARAALKKLVKQAASLADLDPRSRHKIRIKAKKLRYMVEFFKTLAKNSGQLTRFLRCLEELQTRLGKIHDEEAKIAFLQEEVRNLPEEAS